MIEPENKRAIYIGQFIALLFFALISFCPLNAQRETRTNQPRPSMIPQNPNQLDLMDSTERQRLDSLPKAIIDTTIKSSIDSIVVFSAKDTAVFYIPSKKLHLKGDAKMSFKDQTLEAEIIDIDFNSALLTANVGVDSAGKQIGFPKFTEKGEVYYGETINYNFRTAKGVIKYGETKLDEGFYFGTKIKRISEAEFFIKDGFYTTCDASEPHYYFGASQMKLVAKNQIMLEPLVFYVEDLPIFIFPFGLFFPTKTGRSSGLIIPNFFITRDRGVVFEELGLYLALSDYWDTKFTGDIYTIGGFMVKNFTQWKLLDVFDGNMELNWGRTRFNPEQTFTENFRIGLRHHWEINPFSRLDANLDFKSQGFNENTQTDPMLRTEQIATSNASYYKTFENGIGLSVSYQRNDNIVSGEYTQTAPLNVSIPNLFPLKGLISPSPSLNWLRDASFRYQGSYRFQNDKVIDPVVRFDDDPLNDNDTIFRQQFSNVIEHRPSLSINPKLGYFTISPRISFSANNYFRYINKTYNPADSTVTTDTTYKFMTEYWYGFGVNVQTRLYGVVDNTQPLLGFIKPDWFGVKALRHTLEPSIGFNIDPDFSGESFNFYGKYYDIAQKREVVYSRFELDPSGRSPNSLRQTLNYNFKNRFEAKVKQKDTMPDLNLELLALDISGAYDFARDSLRLSNLNLNFRTPAVEFLNFQGSAELTFYDEDATFDNKGNQTGTHRVNRYLLSAGKGFARLTNLNLSINTSFNSTGVKFDPKFGQTSEEMSKDSIRLSQRFLHNEDTLTNELNNFGDDTPGFTPISVPWSINLGLIYNYDHQFVSLLTRTLNLTTGLTFDLTPTWKFGVNAQLTWLIGNNDPNIKTIQYFIPNISATKDMHCWELNFRWSPIGPARGFYLRFGIKSSQLKDLMLEKQSNPIYR